MKAIQEDGWKGQKSKTPVGDTLSPVKVDERLFFFKSYSSWNSTAAVKAACSVALKATQATKAKCDTVEGLYSGKVVPGFVKPTFRNAEA